MTRAEQLERVITDPAICGGRPCIRGTRIEIPVILDSLAAGMSPEAIRGHFPQLSNEDILAAIAYASEIARDSVGKV